MKKLVMVKQAADLHTNYFSQKVLSQFLHDNKLDEHVEKIKACYKLQKEVMQSSIKEKFPDQIKMTNPQGGMFLWLTLPEQTSSMTLFEHAIKEKVAFVPGFPFYVDGGGKNTLRMNYSNSDPDSIREGISRLSRALNKVI